MSELQFVRVEGDQLILRSPEGEEFHVEVDDILRAELKRSPKPEAQTVSPREVQEAIRAGESVDELVERLGADRDFVIKWATPVLDELAHVITAAQGVRINLAGDRFSDVTQISFGELISRRLHATEATNVTWSSSRIDLHTWIVTARFDLPAGPAHATWTFDPRKLTLTPENESALSLSSAEALNAGPIPRLRPVTADGPAKHPSTARTNPTASISVPATKPTDTNVIDLQATQKLSAEDLPTPAERPEPPVRSTIKEAIAKAAEVTIDEAPVEVEPTPSDEVAPNPVDLLDALRQKRAERESATTDELPHKVTGAERPLIPVSEPEPVTSAIKIIDESPLVEAEESQVPAVEPEDALEQPDVDEFEVQAPKVEPKKGRASIPSWDEIVFGTKTDEN